MLRACATNPNRLVACVDPRRLAACEEPTIPGNICYAVTINLQSAFQASISNLSDCSFSAGGNLHILTQQRGGNPPDGMLSQGCDNALRAPYMVDGLSCPYGGSDRPVCGVPVPPGDQCFSICDRINGFPGTGFGRTRMSLVWRQNGGLERATFFGRQWLYYPKEILGEPPLGNIDYSTACCYLYADGAPPPDAQAPYANYLRFHESQAIVLPFGSDICDHPNAVPYCGAVTFNVYLRPPSNVTVTDISGPALEQMIQEHPDWWTCDFHLGTEGMIPSGIHPGGHFAAQLVNVSLTPNDQDVSNASMGTVPGFTNSFEIEAFEEGRASVPNVEIVPEGFPFPESTICKNTYYHVAGPGAPPTYVGYWAGLIPVARLTINGVTAP